MEKRLLDPLFATAWLVRLPLCYLIFPNVFFSLNINNEKLGSSSRKTGLAKIEQIM